MPPVLIFVQSKGRAQQLYHEISYEGIRVDRLATIHSSRDQQQVRVHSAAGTCALYIKYVCTLQQVRVHSTTLYCTIQQVHV